MPDLIRSVLQLSAPGLLLFTEVLGVACSQPVAPVSEGHAGDPRTPWGHIKNTNKSWTAAGNLWVQINRETNQTASFTQALVCTSYLHWRGKWHLTSQKVTFCFCPRRFCSESQHGSASPALREDSMLKMGGGVTKSVLEVSQPATEIGKKSQHSLTPQNNEWEQH